MSKYSDSLFEPVTVVLFFFFNKKISLYIKFRFAAKTYLLTFAKWTWHVFRVFSVIIGWKNPHKTWILAHGFSAIFLAGLCFTVFLNLQLHLLLSVNISKKWTEFANWRKKKDPKDERMQFLWTGSQNLCQEVLCMWKKELSWRKLLDPIQVQWASERSENAATVLTGIIPCARCGLQ